MYAPICIIDDGGIPSNSLVRMRHGAGAGRKIVEDGDEEEEDYNACDAVSENTPYFGVHSGGLISIGWLDSMGDGS
jgi:hypothetical protein